MFLAPSIYPDTSSVAIAKAQLMLSVQNKLAGRVQALPSLDISTWTIDSAGFTVTCVILQGLAAGRIWTARRFSPRLASR